MQKEGRYTTEVMKYILTETICSRTQRSCGPRLWNVARCNHIPWKGDKISFTCACLHACVRWMANRRVREKSKQFFTFDSIVQLLDFFYSNCKVIDYYDEFL